MDAGRRVFARKGLGGVSLREDILSAAGVSSGSFYHQFDDKVDLLIEILRHDGAVVVDAMQRGHGADEPDPARKGAKLLRSLFELAEQHPDFMKIYVREYHSDDPRVRRCIRELNEQTVAINRGVYEALAEQLGVAFDADAVARMASVFSFAIINHYLDTPKKGRPEARDRWVRSMVELMSGGILHVGMGPRDD